MTDIDRVAKFLRDFAPAAEAYGADKAWARIERVYRVVQDIVAAPDHEPVSDAHEWQMAAREALEGGDATDITARP